MKSKMILLSLASAGLVLGGCANREVKQEVEREVQAEPQQKSAELEHKGYSAVEHSSFTPEQKLRLTSLIERTHEENARIVAEDSKLKGVLIEAITASPYQAAQVEEIKGRLIKVNQKRIKNVLASLNEVEKIIGRDHHDQELVYKELMMQPPGVRDVH